ncbi:MAG: ogr/Delta-like zinc finger family protein [Syntrophaceae bacterium]|nr:ogr/Delta-like zinc finger family protein [Syntrophaceae bacterium]
MSKESLKCPHCGAEMDPINTPDVSSWGGEVHHVCFNDECSYYKKSWEVLDNQGVERTGYRCRIDPRGASGPLAVWSADALKDLICEKR